MSRLKGQNPLVVDRKIRASSSSSNNIEIDKSMSLRCLEKAQNCTSKECERIVDCNDKSLNTHCYAVTKLENKKQLLMNNKIAILNSTDNILYAGCWTGGDECSPPMELVKKINTTIREENEESSDEYIKFLSSFKIDDSLLEPFIQTGCIGYSKSDSSTDYFTRNNQTYCCCSTSNCNLNLIYTKELNPYEVYAPQMNPKQVVPPPTKAQIRQPNIPNKNGFSFFLNHRDLTIIFLSSLVALIIFSAFVLLFILFRKKILSPRKPDQFPSIFYSKSENNSNIITSGMNENGDIGSIVGGENLAITNRIKNLNDLNQTRQLNYNPGVGSNLTNHQIHDSKLVNCPIISNGINNTNINLNQLNYNVDAPNLDLQQPPNKVAPLNKYSNFKDDVGGIDDDEYNQLTHPLLAQSAFASSIVAPNVQLMPDNNVILNQLNSICNNNGVTKPVTLGIGGPMIELNKHDLNEMMDFKNMNNNLPSSPIDDSIDNSLLSPKPLRSSDIYLLDKIAHGQFSCVWKGRIKKTNVEADEQQTENLNKNDPNFVDTEPEYAVKIFAGHQKSAWLNEKEIYNSLSTSHESILKFFGSDVHRPKQSQKNQASQMPVHDTNLFFPFSSNEYWLITEYHQLGSLHDFLKNNYLSWPQMVSLANSLFEGLAFLHSENNETHKTFAIAHRDLKSKNILVKNDSHSCCIGDFGLALKLNSRNKLSSAEIRSKVGTKRYMSPELIEGAIAFTKETFLRIDVYASALVLWEILSRGDFYDEKCQYKLPFEDEVGLNPSLEEMKEVVVDKNIRPVIKQSWLKQQQLTTIAQTIEECWDIDLDARISAECAASRIRKIYKNIYSKN